MVYYGGIRATWSKKAGSLRVKVTKTRYPWIGHVAFRGSLSAGELEKPLKVEAQLA